MADETSTEDTPGTATAGGRADKNSAVYNVPIEITAVLGTAVMPISQILKLGRGAVVELDRAVGEAIDVMANKELIAHGEVVVVDDRLAVNMTDVIRAKLEKL